METRFQSRSRMHTWSVLKGVAVTLVLFLIGYLAVGAVAANALTIPKRQFSVATSPSKFSLTYQDVRFPARGGDVEIAGWYIPREGSHRAVVLVHGKDSSRSVEFDGTFVDLAAALHQGGFNVLMIDLRGHGQSGEGRYSFGLNERRDVEGAVDWLSSKGFQPGSIGVLGVSLGAASAVGAAAEEPRIGALVTDSAFSEFCPVLQSQWKSQTGLPDILLPPTLLMTRVMFGYDLCTAKPVNEIGRIAPRPVLLIHSTGDLAIPVSHAVELKRAAPSAEIWVVEGPEHARIYNADPAAYSHRVVDFYDKSLQ